MPRAHWRLNIKSKAFYVHTYRKLAVAIIMSILLNMVLCIAIGYVYLHQPERLFYASNGVMEPIALDPLAEPNDTGNYLLSPDPLIIDHDKMIPG